MKVRTPSVHVNVSIKARGKAKVNVTVNTPERQQERPRRPLRFGHGNAKLDPSILTFSIPAGWTCPNASACKSRADRETGRITDGPDTEFRCYAASMEARHRSVRNSRWHNWQALRACKDREAMVQLILDSLSPFAGYVRIHDSGDFWSQDYLDAWLEVARRRPRTVFYCYSKALPLFVRRLDAVPDNFLLTASYGGTHDHLIDQYQLRYAKVVLSEAEAEALGLEIDHDDSHAMQPGPSFALLIHGTQPAGTPAAKAVASLRAQGEFGYGEKADQVRVRNGRMPLAVIV